MREAGSRRLSILPMVRHPGKRANMKCRWYLDDMKLRPIQPRQCETYWKSNGFEIYTYTNLWGLATDEYQERYRDLPSLRVCRMSNGKD